MISFPVMVRCKSKGKGFFEGEILLNFIILVGFLPCVGSLLKIGGQSIKSPTESLACFLSGEKVLAKLEKHSLLLLSSFALYTVFTAFVTEGKFCETASSLAILAAFGMARVLVVISSMGTDHKIRNDVLD